MTRSPSWYVARARAMSGRELAWRASQTVRRHRPPEWRELDWHGGPWPAFLRGLGLDTKPDADRIAGGELCYWGRSATVDPHAPPWEEGPLPRSTDPKSRWELRRHQHLLALAAGGRERLCVEQLLDWVGRRPARDEGSAAAYEASHRLVTWSWALPLAAPAATQDELARIGMAFTADAALGRESPSLYSSANNHRLAELAGLLAFEAVTIDHAQWEQAWSEFEAELVRQTFADGGSREQAAGSSCTSSRSCGWPRSTHKPSARTWAGSQTAAGPRSTGSTRSREPTASRRPSATTRKTGSSASTSSSGGGHRCLPPTARGPRPQPGPRPPSARSESIVLRDSGYVVMRDGPVRLVVDVGPLDSARSPRTAMPTR